MAYSEDLAERIRDVIGGRPGVRERKMFGGVAWMVNGNMAVGVMTLAAGSTRVPTTPRRCRRSRAAWRGDCELAAHRV
jgi:hypothetical protein